MIKIKIGSFFEEHIEKIVLVIFGLLCVWLMITRVLLSPNQVVYDDERYSPSAIDERVYEDAKLLRQKLEGLAGQQTSYQSKADESCISQANHLVISFHYTCIAS